MALFIIITRHYKVLNIDSTELMQNSETCDIFNELPSTSKTIESDARTNGRLKDDRLYLKFRFGIINPALVTEDWSGKKQCDGVIILKSMPLKRMEIRTGVKKEENGNKVEIEQ